MYIPLDCLKFTSIVMTRLIENVKVLFMIYEQLTLSDIRIKNKSNLENLIEIAGSKVHLSRMLGLSSGTIYGWLSSNQIPRRYVDRIRAHAAFSHLSANEVRYDG